MSYTKNGYQVIKNAIPIDVANLILYLSSKNSEYINGQIIFMDGGMEC